MNCYVHVGMFTRRFGQRIQKHFGERLVELYLQFGYGMMGHCRSLIGQWGGGTAILSPRDLNGEQLVRLAGSITKLPNGRVLLDPQFYLPHSDHERLCSHEYWPKTYQTNEFWQGGGQALTNLTMKLTQLNQQLDCTEFILPGLHADSINDDWLATQEAVLEEATARTQGLRLLSTIALSADAARNQDQIALLLERSEAWKPHGYYVVCEHPNGNYLVDDPNWLANVLDLAAGFKLRGAKVILGYCNHQMLIAATTKTDAIASGTWMNVRSFPPDKFRVAYDEEIKQRTTWYYCPQALSEYKIPFLDIANRQDVLNLMASPAELDGGFATPLFSGAQPTAVGFTEQAAFRHYLHCLRAQTADAVKPTFDETVAHHQGLLTAAQNLLGTLQTVGVRGQLRDFTEIVDVNSAALAVLLSTRGAMLRRRWASL